jgi:hypothetical protein
MDDTTPRITFADDAIHRVISSRVSNHKTSIYNEKDATSLDVEEAPREGDFRKKQVSHALVVLILYSKTDPRLGVSRRHLYLVDP